MVAAPEKRILWHPRASESRFVVGNYQGGQILLYEWDAQSSQIRHLNSIGDLPSMKCFDWASQSASGDIFAVGLANGKISLLNLHSSARQLGSLFSPRSLNLPVRIPRACNALAFNHSSADTLAAGFDKVRGEASLVIYDVEAMSSAFESLDSHATSGSSHTRTTQAKHSERSLRATVQYATGESVSSVTFLPRSKDLVVASVSQRWIRLFDLRTPTPTNSSVQSVASKSQTLCIDPFETHRIASFGDGLVTLWDFRSPQSPLLSFTERDAAADGARSRSYSNFVSLQFSSSRRGLLASLERESRAIRFWETISVAFENDLNLPPEPYEHRVQATPSSRLSWVTPSSILPWTSQADVAVHQVSERSTNTDIFYHILSNTQATKPFSSPLVNFVLIPQAHDSRSPPSTLAVTKDGDLENRTLPRTSHSRWNTNGELLVAYHNTCTVFHDPELDASPHSEPWERASKTAHVVPLSSKVQKAETEADFGRGDHDGFPALSSNKIVDYTHPRRWHSQAASPAASTRPSARTSPTREYNTGHNPAASKARNLIPQASSRHGGERAPRLSSKTSSKTPPELRTSLRGMQDDISIIMKKRALRGYSLGHMLRNASIWPHDPMVGGAVSHIWKWVHHCEELLGGHSNVMGYDFTYQGVQGIWEGLHSKTNQLASLSLDLPSPRPSTQQFEHFRRSSVRSTRRSQREQSPALTLQDSTFNSAVNLLVSSYSKDKKSPRLPVTANYHRRILALRLCGLLGEEDDQDIIRRWDREGQHSRAACWAAFTDHVPMAIDILVKSNDDSDRLASGILTILSESKGSSSGRSAQMKEQYTRLIPRLDDVYLRAMLNYLALDDWEEVLTETQLPMRERLTIALCHLSDSELADYIRNEVKRAKKEGDLSGLMLTGITEAGLNILQTYVDLTGDVQTAALISCLTCPSAFESWKALRWLHSYKELLTSWRMHSHRSELDIQHGLLIRSSNPQAQMNHWKPDVILRCNFCNKTVNIGERVHEPLRSMRDTACPSCGRGLPRCSICLLPIGVPLDVIRNAEIAAGYSTQGPIDWSLLFCQTCKHGGHAVHILAWFEGFADGQNAHSTCPVSGCECKCLNEPTFE